MPSKCAVLSCPIYSPSKEHHLFRIPAVRVRASEDLRQQMLKRRARWGEVLRLTDPQMTHALVCGRHFVSGKPSASDDVESVDWIPTLHLDVQDDQVRRRSMYQPVKQESDLGHEPMAGTGLPIVRIETTSSTCCIPGCVNREQQWLTDFPRDDELRERWLTAISVGSGETISADQEEDADRKAQVCNMHFAAQAPEAIANGVDNKYREPTLFVRNDILIQVASCRLCMKFDTVDNMFNMKLNISDGHSLQWMAKKYFAQFLLIAEYAEEGYFCERCTVQIDMSHAFWREISEKSRRFKLLLRKMTTERVEFSSKVESGDDPNQSECTPGALIIKDEPLDDADMQQYFYNPVGQSRNASMESTITEEKPSLSDPSSIHLVKPPPLKVQLNFKCYVCSSRHESKNALIHHLMMDHQDHSSLNCQECNLSFKNIILFNKHLAMHDPSKRIKCSHCPLRFRKTSARTKHEVARHGVAPPPKNQYMTASATTATAASKDKVKRYPCSQCDKGFMYMSELQRHEKSCSGSFETEDETETGTDLHDEESLPPIYSNDFDAAAETDSDSVADMQQESNNQTPPTTQTSRRSRGRYREPLINDCDCRMKCGSKISVAKQIEINTQFWTLSKKGQQSFILNFSHRRPIKRRQESNFRRLFSYDYQLEDEHGLLQDVCSAFFLNTLGYDVRSSNMIYRYHDRAHAGPAPPSARGKYTRPKALHEAVKDDILTYASISVQDGQSMYLPPSLSYQGMFDSFNERRLQNQEQTCNYSFYCKRLRELNVKKSL